MEDNSKLFVFDKKEVILIFVFIFLVTITSFTLGVRFGKSIYLKQVGITKEDVQKIDLKSVEEEKIEEITKVKVEEVPVTEEVVKADSLSATEDRIREEINKLANPEATPKVIENKQNEQEIDMSQASSEFDELYKAPANLSGKYTIQLASFELKEEAQSFADGFIASGYDAIINEVEIPSKGSWYRVSVGLFDSLNEAKSYLEKEKKFFQGKDYLVKKFK